MARRIDIRLLDTFGARTPVRGGIPFPLGAITSADQVRLRAAEADIPFDAEPIARWPDGSVRWLRLDFIAPEQARVCLHYGNQQHKPAQPALIITETANAYKVSTGPLEFEIGRTGFGVLTNCLLSAGRHKIEPIGPQGIELVTKDYFRATYLASREAADYACEIEERGAHHAVFRFAGSHVWKDQKLFDYEMRLFCWAGSTAIRLQHIVKSRQEEELPLARAVEIRLPLADSPLVFSTGIESGYSLDDDINDGVSLVQRGPTRMRSGERFVYAQDGSMVGRCGEGWISVSGETAGVTAAVRRFWQQHPKGFAANPGGPMCRDTLVPTRERDCGQLAVLLWPEDAEEPMTLPKSCEKTHDVMLIFHGVRDAELAEAALIARAFTKPAVMACTPSWYCASGALGDLMPAGSKGFEDFGRAAAGAFAALKKRRSDLRDYGDFDYGDFADADIVDGWINVEYDTPHCLLTQFARSAKRDYLDFGLDAAAHQGDIDIAHYVPTDPGLVGSQSIHAVGHLGRTSRMFYHRTDHIWAEGLVKAYWLSGDRRCLEHAMLVGDFLARTKPCPDDNGAERPYAWSLIGLMAVYEATLDAKYLNAAREVAGMVLTKSHPKRGLWLRDWGTDEKGNPIQGSSPFMSGLLLEGLIDYNAYASDPEVDVFIVRSARTLVRESWIAADGGFHYHPGLAARERGRPTDLRQLLGLVHAYELTGDRRLLDIAVASFNAGVRAHLDSLAGANVKGAADKSAKNYAIFLRSAPRFAARLKKLR